MRTCASHMADASSHWSTGSCITPRSSPSTGIHIASRKHERAVPQAEKRKSKRRRENPPPATGARHHSVITLAVEVHWTAEGDIERTPAYIIAVSTKK